MLKERFAVIWQKCNLNSELSKRFNILEFEGYLPFFIWGDLLNSFEKKETIQVGEEQLLKGILFGFYEYTFEKKPWHRVEDRNTYMYLLDYLGNGFKFKNPEGMILDTAANIRDNNGSEASRIVLESGLLLIKESLKIKSDLIMDLWDKITEKNVNDIAIKTLKLIIDIKFEEILQDAKEVVSYYGLCSLIILKRLDQIDQYLTKYVYSNIKKMEIKKKVKYILENIDQVNIKEISLTPVST